MEDSQRFVAILHYTDKQAKNDTNNLSGMESSIPTTIAKARFE